jgi:hypothetical protein
MYCHAGERHEPDISRLWLSNGYFYNACVCSVKFLMISNGEMSEVWGGGVGVYRTPEPPVGVLDRQPTKGYPR